ncbi:MAG: peptidyl-prolyl cis-trans isomerase [Candidatus Paracaedibacteraceae bacterium]|nr:peptidyl-prolyl cis-trans isomerase [Candidatus Paracaedibacteraceae bacterium]
MFKFSRLAALALSLTVALPSVAATNDSTVVAKVDINGKKVEITVGELKRRMKSLPPQLQGEPLDKIFDPLVQSSVDMAIITHLAKKAGLDKDEEVKARIADCQEAMLQKAYLDKQIAQLQTDEELKKAYDELIKVMPDMDEISFYQAIFRDKKKAEEFIKSIKAKGGDFEKALKEGQEKDPELKGGKADFVKIPELPPELSAAMEKAKGGVLIDKPVEEKLGAQSVFFVVKVIERRKAKKPSFEDAKSDLKGLTVPKYAQEVIEAARKDFKIEKFDMEGKPVAEKKEDASVAKAAPAA